jgi:hypothetical protein
MIGHQAIGVHLASKLGFALPEIIKIVKVVVRADENNLTIVAALDDVVGAIWQD